MLAFTIDDFCGVSAQPATPCLPSALRGTGAPPSSDERVGRQAAVSVTWALCAVQVAGFALSYLYFSVPPAILSLGLAALLAVAARRSHPQSGGKRSLETMTPEERSARAKKAATAAAQKRTAE